MWRDNLPLEGRGSWRGREFFVSSAESEIGRRTVVHEFPQRDTPHVEDNGRLTRRFHLTCYVLGKHQDYDVDRDLLRDEFEKPGDGKLVHPYWGDFTAQVVSPIKIKETDTEGGLARFDLDLVDVVGQALTQTDPDLAPLVEIKADDALIVTNANFVEEFSLAGAVNSVRNAAVGVIGGLTDKISQVRGTMNAALQVIDDVGDAITELKDGAAALLLAPERLVTSVQGVVGAIMGAASTLDAATAELITFIGAGGANFNRLFGDFRLDRAMEAARGLQASDEDLEPVPDTGSTQEDLQSANQRALVRAFKVVSIVETARALVLLDLGSRDKTLAARTEITAIFDVFLEDPTTQDELWAKLKDLRDMFSARMLEIAAELPQLTEFIPPMTMPALVIAYDVHGDADREAEIILRNDISDPNFTRGSEPLLVASDG